MRATVSTLFCTMLLGGAIAAPKSATQRDTEPDQVICNIQNFKSENWGNLLINDISDLRSAGSLTIGHQAGGGYCNRLKCDNGFDGDVAIYVCNDGDADVTVDTANVADLAQAILNNNDCLSSERKGKKSYTLVQGQAFNHTGGWNVILGIADGESC